MSQSYPINNSFPPPHFKPLSQPKNASERIQYMRDRSQERIHIYAEVAKDRLQQDIDHLVSNNPKDKRIAKRYKIMKEISELEQRSQDLLGLKFNTSQDMQKLTRFSHQLSKDFKKDVDKLTFGGVLTHLKRSKWLEYQSYMRIHTRERKFSKQGNRGFELKRYPMKMGDIQSESVIIPCNLLPNTFVPQALDKTMYASVERRYAPNLANLQESKYFIEGHECFSGLRSAALACDPKTLVLDSEKMTRKERLQAVKKLERQTNAARAEQLLTLGFSRFLLLPENRLFLQQLEASQAIQAVFPRPFTHTTMSLLSLIGEEKHMFMEELRALQAHTGAHDFILEIGGRKITITANVHVDAFNMASSPFMYSNWLNTKIFAVQTLIYVISGLACQIFLRLLSRQHQYNRVAWNHLNNRFETFEKDFQSLMNHPQYTEQERQQFQQRLKYAGLIREQILTLGGPDAYISKQVSNPAAVQARILVLASLMGESVHWHCKSGKDRTGIVDIEIKYLLHHLFVYDTIPPLNAKLESNMQREVRRTIALEGGNSLVSWENTGELGIIGIKHSQTGYLLGKPVARLMAGDCRLA